MHKKTFQYRIYPTRAQETVLEGVLDACRWVYNKTLEIRKTAWGTESKSLSMFDTIKFLPAWKSENDFLKKAHSQCLQNTCERVDLAMKAFFRRLKSGETPGYPRFRGKNRYDSFTFTQSGFKLTPDGKLDLSKVGRVKIILHRPIEGKIKTLTIKRTSTRKWFASFVCEVEENLLPINQKAIGIDVGLKYFATLSNGETIENPRFFHKAEKDLAKVQRKFSKQEKGSPKRRFHRKAMALMHEKIANRRKDFTHKLSRRLVNEFGVICFEDLNIKNMAKGRFAKSILDAAWNQFIMFTVSKAACAGRLTIKVNPCNTSKMCSRCGVLVEKDLSVRVHKCHACGLSMDRDWNAACNILRLGLQSLGNQAVEAVSF